MTLGTVVLVLYTYAGYPWLLRVLASRRQHAPPPTAPGDWPTISFSVPAFNEEEEIGELIESLLAIDYPEERRQILIVSDASTDGTDEIVRSYADRGVELVRMSERGGKTAAEAEAAKHLTGEIVINTDASIRIAPDAVKALVARFLDPAVGVASGRDVSITRLEADQGEGENEYVGYEMDVRALETRVYGIVGASGCFYGIRRELHTLPLPQELSRDFAAALHAEEEGFRAVSVNEAVCYVPRAGSIQQEYRRKVRTIQRGMRTLWHKRHLLNPFRHPAFSFMLWSHKILRWMLPWVVVAVALALAASALEETWAAVLFTVGVLGVAVGAMSWWWLARGGSLPRPLNILAFGLMSNVAAARALVGVLLLGQTNAVWEPTRRRAG